MFSEEQVICENLPQASEEKSTSSKRGRSAHPVAPARDKAPLAACGAEKLRATVIADRIRLKDLEARLQNMQRQIEKHGVNVSKPLEKDLLTIMQGQNLDSTPHMKFFWEQQIRLFAKRVKMGRRYHPQVIRFCFVDTLQIPIGL